MKLVTELVSYRRTTATGYEAWDVRERLEAFSEDEASALMEECCEGEGDTASADFVDEETGRKLHICASFFLGDLSVDVEEVGVLETCPRCNRRAVLSDASERSVLFDEPLCDKCRETVIRDLSMDSFDIMYERARANGWAD